MCNEEARIEEEEAAKRARLCRDLLRSHEHALKATSEYASILESENEQLRRKLRALRPFHPRLLEVWELFPEDGSRTFLRFELAETAEDAEEEEPWDEETAARAQAEMIAAHRK